MALKKSHSLTSLIIAPHVSEKTSMLQGQGAYVFKVSKLATKILLKKAIENRYGVKIESVKILGAHPKTIRRGATLGHRPGYKKAIIKLKKGDVLPEF